MTIEIPLSRGQVALIDDVDADLLLQTSWHAIPGSYTWYAARGVRRGDGRWTIQLMHKVLTGWPRTDHANGNGLDNRRANLRPATTGQNIANLRKGSRSSRFKGVSWWRRTKRWQAYIMVDGRQSSLGHFADEEEASAGSGAGPARRGAGAAAAGAVAGEGRAMSTDERLLGQVAQPGDPELDCDLENLIVTAVVAEGREILAWLKGGSGWWVESGSGERADVMSAVTDLRASFGQDMPAELFEAFVARLERWRDTAAPIRMCAAPGKASMLVEGDGHFLPWPRSG